MKRSVASGRNRPLAVSFAVSVLVHLLCLSSWGHVSWTSLPVMGNAPVLLVTLAPQTPEQRPGDMVPDLDLLVPPVELGALAREVVGALPVAGNRGTVAQDATIERPGRQENVQEPSAVEVTPPPPRLPEYLPTSALSSPPEPVTDIQIDWPPMALDIGIFRGVFTLLIDEQGKVQKAVADAPTLTPQMEERARQAFLGARFSPGMLDGKAVKSALRVEVEFEYKPEEERQQPPRSAAPVVVEKKQL
jgi:hypothetical protein